MLKLREELEKLSQEQRNLAESSKEGNGQKMDVLPMIMIYNGRDFLLQTYCSYNAKY
jgi:hypothetical protein